MFFREKTNQIIHLYTICWNEEYMLKYFFRHYDKIVDRYIIFDDGSTDASLSILKNHPKVEVRKLPRLHTDSFVLSAKEVHDHCWKESRGVADWVILTAIDEFLYSRNFKNYLNYCSKQGITAIPALGYQMISHELPTQDEDLTKLVRRGCPWHGFNKLSLFNPNELTEINNLAGRHSSKLQGVIKYPPKDVLLNLHYKYLSFEHAFARYKELELKLGTVDKLNGWGTHYSQTRDEFLEREWNYCINESINNIFSVWYQPAKQHSDPALRWWHVSS